ncbi:MAG: calcium/proton exchanger, partial [Gemmatimonadota bacterium]
LGHDFIGTEHLLLALAGSTDSSVTEAFGAASLTPETVRLGLEQALRPGPHRDAATERPLRSGARKLLDAARAADPAETVTIMLTTMGRERRGPIAQALGRTGKPERAEQAARPAKADAEEEAVPAVERPRRGGRGEPRSQEQPRRRERPPRPVERVRAEIPPLPPPRVIPPKRKRFKLSYLLLVFIPLSWVLAQMHADPLLVFGAACIAVLPLAGLMGTATEHLAHRTGPSIGGLLNATFGNAAELIIALVALRAGLVDLVKASITGSILGNLLLILGLSLIAGGLRKPVIKFNQATAGMSAAMLSLAVVGLVMPALFHSIHPEIIYAPRALHLSEIVAVLLGLTYLASLYFSLRTHKDLFAGVSHPVEGPVWSVGVAVAVLAAATVGVSIESEILVHATEAVTRSLGLTPIFLGLIIIPLIGNAAEHATAVVLAGKGQMDIALQVALGSSTQVALFVAPVLVLAGLLMGQPMDLVFTPFEVIALGLGTGVVAIITLDGESHWFEGLQLLVVYGIIAAAALVI